MDSDIYILKEGVIRHVDLHGEKEQTFAFGRPGTIYMSMFPFVYHKPSYWQYEACCRTEVLKIKQEDFWRMVNSNHEVAVWMLRLAYGQIAFLEYINSDIKDSTAQERFLSLLEKRPEIIRLVPQKIIASYLDITPEYFSHLKKKFMKTERQ